MVLSVNARRQYSMRLRIGGGGGGGYFVKEELSLLLPQNIGESLTDLVFSSWEPGDEVLHVCPSPNTSL